MLDILNKSKNNATKSVAVVCPEVTSAEVTGGGILTSQHSKLLMESFTLHVVQKECRVIVLVCLVLEHHQE